jgi:hypothetical protein
MTDHLKELMERSLEHAVQQHFCQLFQVLMVDPSEPGMKRFAKGLNKLAVTEAMVGTMIQEEMG